MLKLNQKGHTSIVTVLLILVVTILVGVAVYFWQNSEKEKAIAALQRTPVIGDYTGEPVISDVPSEATTPDTKLPVVVYNPNGLFTPAEIKELETKFVNPFIDWNRDNKIRTVSINVEKPTPAVPGYAYKVTYINEGGSNGGFLYGMNTPLEWWMPECMGPDGCIFTDEFENNYPEIVKKFNK